MPRMIKGSKEAKEFMAKIRSKKKTGKGFFGDVISSGTKMLKNELINKVPIPDFIKEPVRNLADKGIDYGVSKSGLGIKRRTKKGAALMLP